LRPLNADALIPLIPSPTVRVAVPAAEPLLDGVNRRAFG
jgi:hypothetical protein